MKTLKEISRECHVSRAGIAKRINKIKGFRKKYMKKRKGMWFINDDAVHIINKKRYYHLPKHYKHPIDHPRSRYDMENDIKRRDNRIFKINNRVNDLIKIIKSQQKTISSQEDIIKEKL